MLEGTDGVADILGCMLYSSTPNLANLFAVSRNKNKVIYLRACKRHCDTNSTSSNKIYNKLKLKPSTYH